MLKLCYSITSFHKNNKKYKCIISTMQSAQYKVKVYEYPNFNNDVTGFNVYMEKFTWGYYELQGNIQSYKMDVPTIYDEIHFGKL